MHLLTVADIYNNVNKEKVECARIFLAVCLCPCYTFGVASEDYRKDAEQGNADAQYNLGFCYDKGDGLIKDNIDQ